MRAKNGILILSKSEVNCLEVLKDHVLRDISYGAGGTFTDPKNTGDTNRFDSVASKKAQIGLKVVDSMFQMTE